MRRAAPQLPISPKLLKHFAAATVVITLCVAMFANGEQAQLNAELHAREAKNELLRTEAEKLGTHKVAMGMKINAHPQDGGDDGGEVSEGSGSADPDARPIPPSFAQQGRIDQQHAVLPRNMPMTPGATVTVKGQIASDLQGPLGDAARAKNAKKAGSMFRPNAEQIESIKAVSRERSGSATED